MELPLDALARGVETLRAAWLEAAPAFAPTLGTAQSEVEQMTDAGLLRVTDELARVRRHVEALLVRAAAEIAERSGPEFGEGGLAKAHGFRNPVRLIAASTGGPTGNAARLIAVGVATADRRTFGGDRLASRHPHVAAALESTVIDIEAASAITTMLDRVAVRADPLHADATEAALVGLAAQVPFDILVRGVREAEARLDHDGVEPRDEALRQERSLTIREDAHGMVRLHARLDPESAAPVKAAIEALVSDVLRRREGMSGRFGGGGDPARAGGAGEVGGAGDLRDPGGAGDLCGADGVLDDRRTIPQIQADALAALARHALGCSQTLAPLAKTTVVVRMSLDALVDGLGLARIDGIDQPISAGTARRMAADAELIPAVFGGGSLPLDLGRSARLFSRAQRLALGERDGGCASCGQNIGYVEAHHIDWWERDIGPTDLSNGVMLCSFCHHTVHREGWQIRVRAGRVWFIPPPHVDPERVPRLGGRARFELAHTELPATAPDTAAAIPTPTAESVTSAEAGPSSACEAESSSATSSAGSTSDVSTAMVAA